LLGTWADLSLFFPPRRVLPPPRPFRRLFVATSSPPSPPFLRVVRPSDPFIVFFSVPSCLSGRCFVTVALPMPSPFPNVDAQAVGAGCLFFPQIPDLSPWPFRERPLDGAWSRVCRSRPVPEPRYTPQVPLCPSPRCAERLSPPFNWFSFFNRIVGSMSLVKTIFHGWEFSLLVTFEPLPSLRPHIFPFPTF